MSRGRNKKASQSEKLLIVLLSGREITLQEIDETLGKEIESYRLSSYLWDLKVLGAQIEKKKNGRKLTAVRLLNVEEMQKYIDDRKAASAKPVKEVKTETDPSFLQLKKKEHDDNFVDPDEAPPVPIFDLGVGSSPNF